MLKRSLSRTIVLATALATGPVLALRAPVANVDANDNRRAAGRLHGDTLAVSLEVRMATWRPEAADGPSVEVAALAEVGRAAEIPGPLIRVREGTVIVATVRNALTDSTIAVHGLVTRPATSDDSLVLRPGEVRTVAFAAGSPGTYFYYAFVGRHSFNWMVDTERDQTSGAFIVDPAAGSPADRVLILNIWGRQLDSASYQNALTINGRSWPYTERIDATVGDTVRWRVINATARNHPMHLHGFYFSVDAHGGPLVDTLYSRDDRRLAVTDALQPYTTMRLSFVPDRPGNWLYHCHIGFHVVPDTRLEPPTAGNADRMAHDPTVHMAGLVVGITVRPRAGDPPAVRRDVRTMHLFVQEGARNGHAPRALGFVLQRGAHAPAADSLEIPGSTLVLTKNQPTDVVVVNRLREAAAIHWHGIELESYSDGVAGWSGAGKILAPSIMPGDSFVAHLTLPRAGTFIYHTHMNDLEQLSSGLYGAIIVLEPGKRLDPTRDHLYVAGWDGLEAPPRVLINHASVGPPLKLDARTLHRFRFVNIGVALIIPFAIYRGDSIIAWRRVAKDGADLPAAQAIRGPASQVLDVGETFDAELALEPGEYTFVAGTRLKPFYSQLLIVPH